MRLPQAEQSIIDSNKVTNYLLSLSHPEGRAKARFFLNYGFGAEDSEVLISALRQLALNNDAGLSKVNKFGILYLIESPLETPDGRNPLLRSVWIIEFGSNRPRLITAYPTP